MDLMVNPTITDFQQDVNGDIKMLKIGAKKEDAYANIIGQAESADLDNNKAASINVSTYTAPVEVTPTAGKDGMKKATITLTNIPSGGVSTLYLGIDMSDDDCYVTKDPSTLNVGDTFGLFDAYGHYGTAQCYQCTVTSITPPAEGSTQYDISFTSAISDISSITVDTSGSINLL